MTRNMRRVAVTGAALVTPAGLTLEANWETIKNGRSAIQPIDAFDTGNFPVKLGGTVTGFDGAAYLKNRRHLRFIRQDVQFFLAAVKMALESGNFQDVLPDPEQVGLYVGSGEPEVHHDSFFNAISRSLNDDGAINPRKFGVNGLHALYPSFLLLDLVNNGLCYASIEHGVMGPNHTFSGGLSGGHAVGEAFQAIRTGEIDLAIAGGHDSLVSCFENFYLYDATGLVSHATDVNRAMNPYSPASDGFVPAEGAACVILEEWERAEARRAPILGEITGYGSNCDLGPDLFRPATDGLSLAAAMQSTLNIAGLHPADIDYINSNGLAIPEYDRAETTAIKRVFGEKNAGIPVSSVKPRIGFAGAAAAPLDLVVTLMALHHQIVPPTLNCSGGDSECDLDYVAGSFRPHDMEYALSLNQSIGGQNCVFILRRSV